MKIEIKKRKGGSFDSKLFIFTLLLGFLGVIAIADASAPLAIREFGDKYYFAKQQLYWFLIGVVILIIASKVNYLFWRKISIFVFIFSLIALTMVLMPGVGVRILGARRWIDLGPFSIQPSEIAKFSLILYLAKLSEKNKKPLAFFLPVLMISALVMLQPDLGTTLVILAIGLSLSFISGMNIVYFIASIFATSFAGLILILTSEYRRNRLLSFISQTEDPLGRAYHIRQIILALGSGGLWGVGLGQSRQKHLFLPETATDSIFAVIAEEIGFIGSLVLISLYLFFILRCAKVCRNSPDTFSRAFSFGVVTWIAVQTILNIGSMVAVVPLTGVPLPFLSYGGSSLLMIMLSIGIILNISRFQKLK